MKEDSTAEEARERHTAVVTSRGRGIRLVHVVCGQVCFYACQVLHHTTSLHPVDPSDFPSKSEMIRNISRVDCSCVKLRETRRQAIERFLRDWGSWWTQQLIPVQKG